MKKSYQFSKEFKNGDLTHRGAGDFYANKEKELLDAIASHNPFDTGWRGCKHEILTSQVICDGEGGFTCSVSISDDFDSEGTGVVDLSCDGESAEKTLKAIQQALYEAHGLANEDQKENQCYRGFTILNDKGSWVETYIQPWNGSEYMDFPPGDYYHKWGFQEETDKIPEATKEKLEDYACSYRNGKPDKFTFDGWTIEPWESENSANI